MMRYKFFSTVSKILTYTYKNSDKIIVTFLFSLIESTYRKLMNRKQPILTFYAPFEQRYQIKLVLISIMLAHFINWKLDLKDSLSFMERRGE